jgi:hypothetical protein
MRWFSAFLITSFFLGCSEPIPAGILFEPNMVVGSIIDICTKQPVPDVTIAVTRLAASEVQYSLPATNILLSSDGTLKIKNLSKGEWKINVSKEGSYWSREVMINMLGERNIRKELDPIELRPTKIDSSNNVVLDILFVVDRSTTMIEAQKKLTDSFGSFLNTLKGHGSYGNVNIHVGVISSDLSIDKTADVMNCKIAGVQGKLESVTKKDCTPLEGNFIRIKWDNIELAPSPVREIEQFKCILPFLRNEGCLFKQPLSTALRAVNDQINPGFFRQGSAIAVIVLSDADDCSATNDSVFDPSADALGPLSPFRCFEYGVTCDSKEVRVPGKYNKCRPKKPDGTISLDDVEGFSDSFRKLRGDRFFFFAIAGPAKDPVEVMIDDGKPVLTSSCPASGGGPVPAIRLNAVVEKLLPNSSFHEICQSDFNDTMVQIAKKIIDTLMPQIPLSELCHSL